MTRSWPPPTSELESVEGVGEIGRRTSARVFAVFGRHQPSWTGYLQTWNSAERSGSRTTALNGGTPNFRYGYELEDLDIEREVVNIEFEIGDNVVYPHHGAGQVVKKEKNILGEREYSRSRSSTTT